MTEQNKLSITEKYKNLSVKEKKEVFINNFHNAILKINGITSKEEKQNLEFRFFDLLGDSLQKKILNFEIKAGVKECLTKLASVYNKIDWNSKDVYFLSRNLKGIPTLQFGCQYQFYLKFFKDLGYHIEARLVYKQDDFKAVEEDGEMSVTHNLNPFSDDKKESDIIGGYARLNFTCKKTEEKIFQYKFLSKRQIDKRKDKAQNKVFWTAWYEEMALKTLVLNLVKTLKVDDPKAVIIEDDKKNLDVTNDLSSATINVNNDFNSFDEDAEDVKNAEETNTDFDFAENEENNINSNKELK